jgi:hypothetical protein
VTRKKRTIARSRTLGTIFLCRQRQLWSTPVPHVVTAPIVDEEASGPTTHRGRSRGPIRDLSGSTHNSAPLALLHSLQEPFTLCTFDTMSEINPSKGDLLPDSRPKPRAKGAKGVKWHMGMWWVPVFCASCGIPYGYVPEENCTFACWLCDTCSQEYGAIAGTMMMPDEVFWQKVQDEQLAHYGRILGKEELIKILEEDGTPLAKLLKERVKDHVRV